MKSKYINIHFDIKDEFLELSGTLRNDYPITGIAENENELIFSFNLVALLLKTGD